MNMSIAAILFRSNSLGHVMLCYAMPRVTRHERHRLSRKDRKTSYRFSCKYPFENHEVSVAKSNSLLPAAAAR